MTIMRATVPVVFVASALALLAACGGSGGSSATTSAASSASISPSTAATSTSTSTSTSTTPAPTTPAPTTPATTSPAAPTGNAGLSAVVLRPSDLPAGWKPTPYKADPGEAAQHATFLKCVGARNTDKDQVAEAHSPDFSAGDAGISSDAERYKSAADLSVDTAALRNPKTVACYKKLTNPSFLGLPAGSTVDAKAFQLLGRQAGQPANVVGNLHADITVTVSGQHARLFLESAFIRGPRIEAEVDYENIGQPVPASLQKTLNARVAARAATA